MTSPTSRNCEESQRTVFMRWWAKFGEGRGMEPSHAAWIAWLERDRLAALPSETAQNNGERGQGMPVSRDAGQGQGMSSSQAENETATTGYRAPLQAQSDKPGAVKIERWMHVNPHFCVVRTADLDALEESREKWMERCARSAEPRRDMPRTFEYLLNAMEHAAQEANPAQHGYAEKRRRVFQYVEDLFSDYLRRHNDALNAEERLRSATADSAMRLVEGHPCFRYAGITAKDCAERRQQDGVHFPRCDWCDCILSATESTAHSSAPASTRSKA